MLGPRQCLSPRPPRPTPRFPPAPGRGGAPGSRSRAPPAPRARLRIPEGYRLTQIAERVEEVVGIPAPRFLRAADSGEWSLPPYLMAGESLEGFLFPETY